jgi:hypothetical protein
MRSRWSDVWMPEEDAYFSSQRPDKKADLIIDSAVGDLSGTSVPFTLMDYEDLDAAARAPVDALSCGRVSRSRCFVACGRTRLRCRSRPARYDSRPRPSSWPPHDSAPRSRRSRPRGLARHRVRSCRGMLDTRQRPRPGARLPSESGLGSGRCRSQKKELVCVSRLLRRAAPRSRRLPRPARGRAPGRSHLREAFAL